MKLKKTGEPAYLLAIIFLALGTVFCVKANFGMSMIAALSYCLAPFFGGYMGLAEYVIQAALLVVFCIVMRRFRWQYLLSFLTALLYGGTLILFQALFASFMPTAIVVRIILFISGTLLVALAVTLFLGSYLPQEVYELFVKGLCEKYAFSPGVTKWVFDLCMLLLAVTLAVVFHFLLGGAYKNDFAGFVSAMQRGGIGIGTFISAAVIGPLVSVFGKLLGKVTPYDPIFPKLKEVLEKDPVKKENKEETIGQTPEK